MTCLILTRNRRPWLPSAIQCAQLQTHPNREILVVSDGEPVADLIPPGVRHLHLDGQRKIGPKRNAGCEQARGEIITHFDDDDFSAPGRLVDQLQRLCESGKAVTGYYSMRFTDGRSWWQYRGASCYALGTSLCYRRDWWVAHPFEPVHVGEDNGFVYAAQRAGQLVSAEAGDLMWATNHAGNTSPRETQSDGWRLLSAD